MLIAKVLFPPSNPLHLPVPFKDKVNQCKSMVSNYLLSLILQISILVFDKSDGYTCTVIIIIIQVFSLTLLQFN